MLQAVRRTLARKCNRRVRDFFIFDNSNVSVVETWNAADGKRWKYTFDAIKPKTGALNKPYKAKA